MSGRFSPPKNKAEFIKTLTGDDSPFNEMRDVVFFAAAVGYREQRRVPLTGKGEAIRWDVMKNRYATEELMDMLAVMQDPEDRELLSLARHDDRITILEEYANGGLEFLRARIHDAGAVSLQSVFVQLIQEYLVTADGTRDESDLTSKILNL